MKKLYHDISAEKQKEYIPNGNISKLIESFWISSANNEKVILAPEGVFRIIYSSGSLSLACNGEKKIYHLQSGFYLIPINTQLITIKHSKVLIGIKMKIFTLSYLLNNNSNLNYNNLELFTNNTENNNFYKQFNEEIQEVNQLVNKLKDCNKLNEFIPFLENFMHGIFSKEFFRLDETLRNKVNYILQRRGNIRIDDMAKEFNESRQNLHRYFMKHLRISPKQLGNIWKINNFIYLNNNNNDRSLTNSALGANYFDQAHCINEFKKQFYFSPKYLRRKNMTFTTNCINNRFNGQYDPK